MWPMPSPREAFALRRRRLDRILPGPKLFAAGLSRPRNFPHNPYPFRAESHFLYLVGRGIEGALLLVDEERTALFVDPPIPDDALWFGPKPTLDELSDELGITVRPIAELMVPGDTALLPPQDAETAFSLADQVGRDVEAGGGDAVAGRDAALADAMIELRLRHDDAAIAQLRLVADVTAQAHREGRDATRPGRREAFVRAAMERAIIENGMATAYAPIVTVRGEILHSNEYQGELRSGDLLLADVGAETPEGFAGDVTRVWPVSGRFSATQRAVYEVVLAAQQAALDVVRPGARFRDVHHAAGLAMTRGLVDLGLFAGDPVELYHRGAAALFFPHGIGHLLGIDVHDMEDLGDRAGYAPGRTRATTRGDRYLRLDRDLEPRMCVTIEPGFYRIASVLEDAEQMGDLRDAIDFRVLGQLADVRGIRIEDDVLVTAEGSEILSAAVPKQVADVERSDSA